MTPEISIILPTYNGARTLSRAIESVIAQTYSSWELLVIDDGSADATAEIAEGYVARDGRVRSLRNDTNLGIQKTLNRGLSEAKGKYVARIDDDDAWIDPEKLSRQMAYMENSPDCVLVGTGVALWDESGIETSRYLLPETDAAIRARMLSKNCFVHSTVLFSRDAAMQAGGYGEGEPVRHVEDYDLWLRLGLLGSMANLPIYAVGFTERAGSLSARNKQDQILKDWRLARAHRHDYPNSFGALLKGGARAALHRFFHLLPLGFQKAFFRWYKKNW